MMCRKVCLDRVNGYTYSELTLRCEDYDLWFKLYANGLRGYVMDDKLYYFREDKESYTRKKFRYRLDEMRLKVNGCRIMGVSKKYYIYALKPVVAGMVPKLLLRCYHRMKYSKL